MRKNGNVSVRWSMSTDSLGKIETHDPPAGFELLYFIQIREIQGRSEIFLIGNGQKQKWLRGQKHGNFRSLRKRLNAFWQIENVVISTRQEKQEKTDRDFKTLIENGQKQGHFRILRFSKNIKINSNELNVLCGDFNAPSKKTIAVFCGDFNACAL